MVLVPGDSFGCPGYFRMAYCITTEKVERSLVALRKFVEETYRQVSGTIPIKRKEVERE